MKASFVVTMHDSHGLPVHAYGVCAVHANADANVRTPGRDVNVARVAPTETTWTCEQCDDESDSSSSPF